MEVLAPWAAWSKSLREAIDLRQSLQTCVEKIEGETPGTVS